MRADEELAECAGLWLAEGDHKTKSEVTFTNNCQELVRLFHNCLKKTYAGSNRPRIYVYSKETLPLNFKPPIENVQLRQYIDIRANKPYYIYRLASVDFVRYWKNLIKHCLGQKRFFPDIVRGIFAGEGNIHTGEHSNRTLRISQGRRTKEFEQLFDTLGLKYNYSAANRMYNFTHKENWDIFAKNRLADLHCDKKAKFWEAYNSYKQNHYHNHFIRNNLLSLLTAPKTKRELSIHFGRSEARIYDLLSLYKKEGNKNLLLGAIPALKCGALRSSHFASFWNKKLRNKLRGFKPAISCKILNFCVCSKAYWVRKDSRVIIISKIKNKYIGQLKDGGKTTQELAKILKVCWRSSFRRLSELKRLGLVKQNNLRWEIVTCDKRVVVL
jgi:hypothetical protein